MGNINLKWEEPATHVMAKTAQRPSSTLKGKIPLLSYLLRLFLSQYLLPRLHLLLLSTLLQIRLRLTVGKSSMESLTTLDLTNLWLMESSEVCRITSSPRLNNGQLLLSGPTTPHLQMNLTSSSWTGLRMRLTRKRLRSAFPEDSRLWRASGVAE